VYESWKATRGSSKQASTFFVTVTVAEIGARFSSSSSVWSNQSLMRPWWRAWRRGGEEERGDHCTQ
jgi:transposase-like protein